MCYFCSLDLSHYWNVSSSLKSGRVVDISSFQFNDEGGMPVIHHKYTETLSLSVCGNERKESSKDDNFSPERWLHGFIDPMKAMNNNVEKGIKALIVSLETLSHFMLC